MSNPAVPNPILVQVRSLTLTAQRYWGLLLAPVLLLTAVAGVFTAIREPSWKATQGLIVRDQTSEHSSTGRFESLDAMKTAQETILEIARQRVLIERVLRQIGPPADMQRAWPTAQDIDDAADAIAITAPQGAEFGSTEVIYVSVEAHDRQRALRLTTAVCDELDQRLRELRREKANSIIEELEKSLALGEADLEEATRELEIMEREVGDDLGELRILNTQGSGESNLRSGSIQIKNELRQTETLLKEQQQMLSFLQAAVANPERILGAPVRLLDKQPALRRLKDGLVDAQLRTAELSGTRSADHPLVKAARIGEQEVRRDLHGELTSAIRGLQAEIEVSQQQATLLREQLSDVSGRLTRLAGLRARYGNLVAVVKQRESIVADVRRNIADARAAYKAALATSFLTRMDSPVIGNKPEGPSSKMIVGAGFGGGLAAACGLLLLLAPGEGGWSPVFFGRRRSDQQNSEGGVGRRAGDAAARGRRADDSAPKRRVADQSARQPADASTATDAADEQDARRTEGLSAKPNEATETLPTETATTGKAANGEKSERERRGGDRRGGDRRNTERRGD